MGIGVVKSLQLKRAAGRPLAREQFVKRRPWASRNALLGMGLWAILWLGYNTNEDIILDANFPTNTMNFIHGVRAYFPILLVWFALLIIFVRAKRLLPWIRGPLGLMLFYAVTGLASSVTLSVHPIDAVYWGANYLAIVLVLLVIVLVADPLADIRLVLKFTWIVGITIMLGLLGAIPFLGAGALSESEGGPVGVRAYARGGMIMGMPSSINTGFARYAAISALVAFPGVMRKGSLAVRCVWGIVFTASMYALAIANGRTETLAFVACLAVLLGAERAKRVVNFLVAAGLAILLGLKGFYSQFSLYITRTGHFDPTLTGRTVTWDEALPLLGKSPWVGFGFGADRYYLGQHMHNAFLHVLIQSGFLGGGAMLLGLVIVWAYILKYFFFQPPPDKSLIPPEIPAVFLFVTISSITESTFAYFSAAWLLSAPIVAYVMALHLHLRRISVKSAQERHRQLWLAARGIQPESSPEGGGVAPSLGRGGTER